MQKETYKNVNCYMVSSVEIEKQAAYLMRICWKINAKHNKNYFSGSQFCLFICLHIVPYLFTLCWKKQEILHSSARIYATEYFVLPTVGLSIILLACWALISLLGALFFYFRWKCKGKHTGCSLNIVFIPEDFEIFPTLAFLCLSSVSVCVHKPGS